MTTDRNMVPGFSLALLRGLLPRIPVFLKGARALLAAGVCTAAVAVVHAEEPLAIEIDLTSQRAFLLQDGRVVYSTPISSGRPGYETPAGSFKVIEKSANHRSSLYGRIVSADGKVLVRDADRDMEIPAGAHFVQAPMPHFLRFDGGNGLHAGYLPGYAASHGCVRLPPERAALFFDIVEVGTPVRVRGRAPAPPPQKRASNVVVKAPAPQPAATPARRIKWLPFFRRNAT